MLMNINGSNINNRTLAQIAARTANNQMNNNISSQSGRMNLMSPMIGRVASAKASCGACGK